MSITILLVVPAPKSPFTTSVFVTAGYRSSPSISIGVATGVLVTKLKISPALGCLSTVKDLSDVAVQVNEKGISLVLAFLEVVITCVPAVPVTVPLGE